MTTSQMNLILTNKKTVHVIKFDYGYNKVKLKLTILGSPFYNFLLVAQEQQNQLH